MNVPTRRTAFDLLIGKGAYAPLPTILEGLRSEHISERPVGFTHSLYQQLWHVVYWQDHQLASLRGEAPKHPDAAAETWPADPWPEHPQAWEELLERFLQGASSLDVMDAEAHGDDREHAGVRHAVAEIAIHNGYHAGQMVQLRQALQLWPPPAGGDTW